MTLYKRIVSLLLMICLTVTILPSEAWAVMGDRKSEDTDTIVDDSEVSAPMLTEEPAAEENPSLPALIPEEEPAMRIEAEETDASLLAAGDESSVDNSGYTTANAAKGFSISTEKQSYMADYGDKFRLPVTVGTDRPYVEGSHAYIGYLAVLEGGQWDQITSWWIDGGRVQYTFTLNSEDFAVNRQLHMVASVFPADNFATGASLCDHRFFLTVNYTGDQIVLDNSMVRLPQQEMTYDGAAKEPAPIVTYQGTRLTEDTDYSVSYRNNIDAGSGLAAVTGKGKYTGTVEKTFPIQKADPVLSFAESSVIKAPGSASFINPLTSVTDGIITFRSSDAAVAAVDARSGRVTPGAEGSAGITADASEGRNYKAGSAGYDLTVSNGQTDVCIVSFDPNGGSMSDTSKIVTLGKKYGTLPVPDPPSGFEFTGWYTAPAGGTLIAASTEVTQRNDHTLYAHWERALAGGGFRISAEDDNTISVTEKKPPVPVPPDPLRKTLIISTDSETAIQRDYEQNVNVSVRNPTDQPVWFYLTAENDGRYPDLSYETIQSGSKDSPMILAAGETANVALSVFAQNAGQETYIIPLTAYVQNDGEYVEDSKSSITLTCALPVLNLSWTLVSSSTTSLSRTYRVRNNGDGLTDLAIAASSELKDFVSFDPIIANYQLGRGSSVEFTVYPDLVKMKNGNIGRLAGQLTASCAGKTSTQECVFDTQGKEITVTTMGELALRQDGNPFTKFEISDKHSLKYKNEYGTFQEVSSSTTLNDVIGNDNYLEYEYTNSVFLGNEMNLDIKTAVKSYTFTGNPADYENGPLITMTAGEKPGTIQVVMQVIMDYESYLQLIGSQNAEQIAFASFGKHVVVESVTNWSIDQVKGYALEQLTGVGWAGHVYDASKYLIDAEAASIKVDYDPRMSQQAKSNYNWATVMKGILTFGGIAVDLTCPAVGFVFSIMTAPLGELIDEYQKALIAEEHAKYMELYSNILGSQCTNRGSISAKFYVSNYGRGQKPIMYTSGRMHGGGYVNREDTNYDISLNGKPVGTTENTGLTDVHMEEIPTDNLLPGRENEIIFDYDTSPGSHSVTTETEITLLYPNDTEIAYIDQPDDLQDVRTKPDFCVYDENIYSDDDTIVGEPAKVHFNVYNRGSRGGWFTITCTDDGGRIVYREVNYYLAAFSGETFSVDWTPTRTSTAFTVTLVNTSVNLEERSSSNNTASHVLTARSRQIPTAASSHIGAIYENEPFSFVINVEQGQDIVGESFGVFGTGMSGYRNLQYETSGSGASRRYRVYSDSGLAAGDYSVNILLSYLTSAATRGTKLETIDFTVAQRAWVIPSISVSSAAALRYGDPFAFSVHDIDNLLRTEITVDAGAPVVVTPLDSQSSHSRYYSADLSGYNEGKHTIAVRAYYRDRGGAELYREERISITLKSEAESCYTFTLSGGIANGDPAFAVYRNHSYREEAVTIERAGSECRFLKTDAMMDNPSDYNLAVFWDSGVIVRNLAATGLVDTTNCRRAVLILDPGNELISARITRYTSASGEYFDMDRAVSWEAPLMLSPGTYSIALSGKVDGIPVSPTIEVDVTEQNQVIDLGSYAAIYYLGIDAAGSDSYWVSLRMRDSGGDSWETYSLSCSYEDGGRTLKCYTTSAYALKRMQESGQVYMLAYSGSEIYFIKLWDTTGEAQPMLTAIEPKANDMILDRSTLRKVTLVTQSGDYRVSEVNLRWDHLSVHLYSPPDNIIYLPDGEYTIEADFTDGTQTFSSTAAAAITGDRDVVLDEDLDTKYTDVVLLWADTYDALATVSCSNSAEHWYLSMENVTSGGTVKALNGNCTFTITLTCSGQPIAFSKALTLDNTGPAPAISIGDHLSGTISAYFANEYEAEDTIRFSINGIRDENGNTLSTYNFDPALRGVATFTDASNAARQFTSPFAASRMSGISVRLPREAGEYSMAAALTLGPAPVSIDSLSGRSITLRDPSNLLSEGAMVLAARYKGGRMAEITSAALRKGTTSVTFDRALSSDWTLFFLDNRCMPLCAKVSLGSYTERR